MKRRNQRQTPNNNNNNDRSNKVSSRKSFSGLETLFSDKVGRNKVGRKAATSMKKKKKSTKTPARFAETFARRQAKQKAPAFPNNSKNKTNHTTNTTTTATNNRNNSRPSQQPFTPSDTRNVASVYLAKYTSTKKSNNSTTNNIHNIIEESPGFNVPSSQQIHVDTFESQDEISNNNNNHNNHNHNSSQDLDYGVPSSQPLLPSVVINEQEDVIDAHPEEMVEEQDLYAPPESALYSSKKTKRSSTNGIFPMSPSATPRYAGSFKQFASSNSSSSSSTSNNISTKTSTMSGFPPPPPQVRMNAAAASSSSSSSSSSSAFSSFSPSSRSMQGGRSSWKVTVDKSLALSSVGGGQIHRALAQSPGSALKTSAGAAWSGKGSSGGRGGSRRAGVGSSYLDRHRTKIRSGKYGKLAQQLLDMQDDVGRKIEQLKALEFQQTHQSSNNSKSQFISRRSDPRTGRFVEIKVCTVTTLKTGHFTARCERTDISVPSKNKYSKHSNSNEYSNEYANESDSNEMEENVPLLPTMEVDLIMNSKRAKSIHVTSGCILRLYEPWLELASHMRQHKQNDYNVVDLLIASDVVVKV